MTNKNSIITMVKQTYALLCASIKNREIGSIYFFAIVNSLLLVLLTPAVDGYRDTDTYFNAYQTLTGDCPQLDSTRTPIYPLFIGFIKSVFPEWCYMTVIVILQHAIFLLTIGVFAKLLRQFVSNQNIVYWTTLIYAAFPIFSTWNQLILTESLSISLIVTATYFALKSLERDSIWGGVATTLLATILWLLRPLLAIFTIALIAPLLSVIWMRKYKSAISLFVAIAVSASVFLLYQKEITDTYNISTPTEVTFANKYCTGRTVGIIRPEKTSNDSLRADIARFIAKAKISTNSSSIVNKEYHFIRNKYSLPEIDRFIEEQYADSRLHAYMAIGLHNLSVSYRLKLFDIYLFRYNLNIFTPLIIAGEIFSLGALYLFMIIYAAGLVISMIRRHKMRHKEIYLTTLIAGNIAISLIGAQGEWQRLLLPTMPFVMCLVAQTINCIFDRQRERKLSSGINTDNQKGE